MTTQTQEQLGSLLCKNKLESPIVLSRDSATPIYERNKFEMNLNNKINDIKMNLNVKGGVNNRNVLSFDIDGGSASLNEVEYFVKKMYIFTPSFHKISTTKFGAPAPMEIVIQLENRSQKSPDFLNVSVFCKPGKNFGRSSSFVNQILGKIDDSKTSQGKWKNTGIAPFSQSYRILNALNLYDILPRNRSYFSYAGSNPDGRCFKNNVQWVVFENTIDIQDDDYNKIKDIFKASSPKTAKKIREHKENDGQYLYYKSDRDATLAGMESGDIKYVKCSRRVINEDPDAYKKYLYNRKQRNKQCDQIFNMNKQLEQQFEEKLNKMADDRTLLGYINRNFEKYNDKIMNFILMIFIFVLLFIAAYSIVYGIASTIKKIKTEGFKKIVVEAAGEQ